MIIQFNDCIMQASFNDNKTRKRAVFNHVFYVLWNMYRRNRTGKWVDIFRHIWQTMDNYWGGIVKWTKILSQILKGDCQIKFHVPFIKKFIHPENHWMWVVGDYWGDWGFLGTLWCIWWREEEGGVPLLGRSPEDAGVDHWVSHQPRATPSFKAKVVSDPCLWIVVSWKKKVK